MNGSTYIISIIERDGAPVPPDESGGPDGDSGYPTLEQAEQAAFALLQGLKANGIEAVIEVWEWPTMERAALLGSQAPSSPSR